MPRRYPSYQTCHRRFKAWHDEGVLVRLMNELFGEEGVALCSTIETRMRRHVAHREREARVQPQAAPVAPVALVAPASPVAPETPSTPPVLPAPVVANPRYATVTPAAPQPYAHPPLQYLHGR
jgi:hypothetical protein